MAYLTGKLLGLLLYLHCVTRLQGVIVKFTNVTCDVKAGIGVVDYCDVKTLSQTKNSVKMRYNLNKPLMNNVWFWIKLMTRNSESNNGAPKWQPYLYPLDINLCRAFKNRYNYVAKMALDLIEGHSNLNHSCPYLEKYIAIDDITNTEVSTKLRGIPMSKGFFSLYTKWIRENITLIQTNFFFEVVSN